MENKKILIAPFAAKLRTGKPNAKNPSMRWWQAVVRKLNEHGYEVIQIGSAGEERIVGTAQFHVNWSLDRLRELVNRCDLFLSVDSFLPHLCWESKLKSGVVVWGVSDPLIFGHDENTNIIKDRKHLREHQFQSWEFQEWNENAFVTPDEVVDAVLNHVSVKSAEPANGRRFVPRSLQLAESATV